jgi:hypothetical protein
MANVEYVQHVGRLTSGRTWSRALARDSATKLERREERVNDRQRSPKLRAAPGSRVSKSAEPIRSMQDTHLESMSSPDRSQVRVEHVCIQM